VSARTSRFLDRRVVALLLKVLSTFAFGVEYYIIFERLSSFCCRQLSLLLKVRSSVSKTVLFFERSILFSVLTSISELSCSFVVESRRCCWIFARVHFQCRRSYCFWALEFVFRVEGRIIFSERSSSFCCRQSSLWLSVRSISLPVSTFKLFLSAGVSSSALKAVLVLSAWGRLRCWGQFIFQALEFFLGVEGRDCFEHSS
jgi:hypothetical protein